MISPLVLALALAVPADAPPSARAAPVAQRADDAPQPQTHSGHSPTSTGHLLANAVARARQERPAEELQEPRPTK
jgi:hypothetical protein